MSCSDKISTGARILLVDDSLENIDLLRHALESDGYSISVATSGEAALEVARHSLPDLILLDIMMPGIDGFETCRRLKSNDELRDIPVIFITAKTETKDVIKGFDLGGLDYITKPFNRAVVVARVGMHIERILLIRQKECLISELRMANQKLEVLAKTDFLTSLSNRRDITEKIEYEIVRFQRNKKPFSLVLLDIDHFKTINDVYGHNAGDCALVQVSQLLKTAARKQDVVGRWGGEEFLILLPETSLAGAAKFAEKLRLELAEHTFYFAESEKRVTISSGICVFDENMTLETCLQLADSRLYRAKESGRNRMVMS